MTQYTHANEYHVLMHTHCQVPLYDVLRLCAVDPALCAAGPRGLRSRLRSTQQVQVCNICKAITFSHVTLANIIKSMALRELYFGRVVDLL